MKAIGRFWRLQSGSCLRRANLTPIVSFFWSALIAGLSAVLLTLAHQGLD
jgi:hypothetical protein